MSDKDWGTLFPGLSEPIKGELSDYREAEREARALYRALDGCHTEFQRMKSDESLAELGGKSARQLVNIIREIDGSFEDLPPVFERLTDIFDHHEAELRELHRKAREALARANTRWTALEEARSASEGATSALASIDSQIASLRLGDPTDPTISDQLTDLESNRYQYVNSSNGASGAVTEAEEAFESSRTEYGNLRQDEQELVESTANKLDDIDLNDLKDPNAVLGFISDVGEWAWDLASGIVISAFKAIEALAEGRFLDALHHLSDALGGVLTVLAIVGLALAVFASGGALLGLIALGLGLAKLAMDSVLAATQHPHPTTGQPKSWGEVAIDAALLAVGFGAGKGVTSIMTRRLNSNLTRPVMTRMPASARTAAGQNRYIVMAANSGRTTIINPATGNRVSGAARNAMVARAQRDLAAYRTQVTNNRNIYDVNMAGYNTNLANNAVRAEQAGVTAGHASDAGSTAVPRPGGSSALGSGDWSVSELAHLTNELTPRAGATHQINSSINSIGDFRTSGPNSTSGSAVFQMAGAR